MYSISCFLCMSFGEDNLEYVQTVLLEIVVLLVDRPSTISGYSSGLSFINKTQTEGGFATCS